jgi:hypothetical protein
MEANVSKEKPGVSQTLRQRESVQPDPIQQPTEEIVRLACAAKASF